jgi:hypothetical protein
MIRMTLWSYTTLTDVTSQNSLTTRFPALPRDLPQVKSGTSHSRSEGIF